MGSFTHKQIAVTLSMASGVTQSGGAINKRFTGLRVQAKIENAGQDMSGILNCAIYGLSLSDMNELTIVGTNPNQFTNNNIILEAGDEETGLKKVYEGQMKYAFADMRAMPQVCFRAQCFSGKIHDFNPATPSTYSQGAGIKQIAKDIAGKMGLTLQDNLPEDVQLSSSYFWGNYRQQLKQAMNAAGVAWSIDNDTVYMTKSGTPKAGSPIILSKDTGMVGYPSFSSAFVIVRSIFNQNIQVQSPLQIISEIPKASGLFTASQVQHNIESMTPKGNWFTEVLAFGGGAGGQTNDPPAGGV